MIIPPLRKSDRYGQGHYLAKRGDRQHRGVDFVVQPGEILFSDVTGVITRHGYVYAHDLDYKLIEIRVDDQTKVKYMYVDPRSRQTSSSNLREIAVDSLWIEGLIAMVQLYLTLCQTVTRTARRDR